MPFDPVLFDYIFNDRRRNHRNDVSATGAPLKPTHKIEPPTIKGHCRYCGRAIARGIYMHEKKCPSREKYYAGSLGPLVADR